MALQFERLTPEINEMAEAMAQRLAQRNDAADKSFSLLEQYATDWEAIAQALALAEQQGDRKFYRSARPLDETEPLNLAQPAPPPPAVATLIATDGSQIHPNRHAAYLYYLINIGGVVYHHGRGLAPDQFSEPTLHFPRAGEASDRFDDGSDTVNIERDLAEIGLLADKAQAYQTAVAPILAILDQRLLYWPLGSEGIAINSASSEWNQQMSRIHHAGALLAGYIDHPSTSYVATLLRSLEALDDENFNWRSLGKRATLRGLTDAYLFSQLLGPGERSKLFAMVSEPNDDFSRLDAANEVCFFYLNASSHGRQIARVDIPLWVAEDPAKVTAVHGLVYDQCQILGDYPYVLARADETAVVTHRDQEQLNFMIDVIMEQHQISQGITAKQTSKNLARGSKKRHTGL